MEAGLGRDVSEPSRLQVAPFHRVFQRTEDVFNGSSSHAHGIGPAVEAGLHDLDQ